MTKPIARSHFNCNSRQSSPTVPTSGTSKFKLRAQTVASVIQPCYRQHLLRKHTQPSHIVVRCSANSQPTPDPKPTAKSVAVHWQPQNLDTEIAAIAFPTLGTLAADPIAALLSTAWVGHLGATELAALGLGLSVYGTVTKLINMPLLSVTTSTVATALGKKEGEDSSKDIGVAASSAVNLGLGAGIAQAAFLMAVGGAGLGFWGAPAGHPLFQGALEFLNVRALGAPAAVLLLVLQGVFRGLGDTRAPLYATVAANMLNMALDPLFIYTFEWGIRGAALATVVSQMVAALVLLSMLTKRCRIQLAGPAAVENALKFLGPTGILMLRTVAITCTYAYATSLATQLDSQHAATHQICFQLWLASSLLADSLAVAAQSLIARSLGAEDASTAQAVVARTTQLGLRLGIILAVGLALAKDLIPGVFTSDPSVLAIIPVIFPLMVATQPVNALAFVWDGVLYGVNGYTWAAQAMVLSAVPAVLVMGLGTGVASSSGAQLSAIWAGLATVMGMRALTIYVPYKLRWKPFQAFVASKQGY